MKHEGTTRKREELQQRWAYWKRLREEGKSLLMIERMTGFDHTTILHALRKLNMHIKAPMLTKPKKTESAYAQILRRQLSQRITRDLRGNIISIEKVEFKKPKKYI